MRRFAPAALVITILVLASPASAHEEIQPATFSTGRATFFTLDAANEKDVDLTRVTLAAPAGVPFGEATRQPAGWAAQPSSDAITWSGGKVAPQAFEQWGFEIEGADQPGPIRYKVTLGFANGESEDTQVDVVAVAAGGAAPTTTTAGASPSTTVTPAVPADGTAGPAPGAHAAKRRADLAIAAAVAAAALALLALVTSIRTGSRPAAPPAGTDAAEGQDW